MSGTVKLERETVEKLEIPLTTTEDPASYTVQFAVTDYDNKEERPTTWINGSWSGAASGSAGSFKRTAVTPSFGGDISIAPGDDFRLWSKLAAGSETVVELIGRVVIR